MTVPDMAVLSTTILQTQIWSRTNARWIASIWTYLNFCASADYETGYCCRLDEVCPRKSICSEDNPKAPALFKYLVCPNEAACEEKVIIPEYDGTILKRAVDKYSEKFVKGDVCSYII